VWTNLAHSRTESARSWDWWPRDSPNEEIAQHLIVNRTCVLQAIKSFGAAAVREVPSASGVDYRPVQARAEDLDER
jgi:hypothetical protein